MSQSKSSILQILLLLIFITGCKSDNILNKNIVATFENEYEVTVQELNKYVEDWLYYKKYAEREDAYRNALHDLLVNQFKRIEFFELGLDKDSNLVKSISREITEELVTEYFEKQYVSKYISEDYARRIYDTMGKEVIYQLIALNKPENATENQLDSLQNLALSIKSEIEIGKDFVSLVNKYSQNKISLANNGYMPPVDWRQMLLDPTGGIIYKLNKNDIRLIKSYDAFNIVRIIDIRTVETEPFDSIKNDIINELKRGYADASLDEFEKDKKALINEETIQWNQKGLNQLVKWSNFRKFYEGDYNLIINNSLQNGENEIILKYDSGMIDYNELLRLLDNILVMRYYQGINDVDVKKFLLEAVRTDLIIKKADALGLRKNIFNPFTTNPAIKNRIAYLYNQVEIEAKIPKPSNEDLEKFFIENEKTKYYQLEKRNLFMMVFSSLEEAKNNVEKIDAGVPFEKVTGNYLVKTYVKEKTGIIKSFHGTEKPILGNVAFDLKESEVSGPLEFRDEQGEINYAIIKCYHIRPEKQLLYSDVKDSIEEDFKNHQRENISSDVEKKLMEKYRPVIHEEILIKLYSAK